MVRPLLASKLGSFGSFCRRDLRCSGRGRQSPGETARNKRCGLGRTWAFANSYMECIYIYIICIIYIYNMHNIYIYNMYNIHVYYIYIYTYLYKYEILWICIYIHTNMHKHIHTYTHNIYIYIYTYTYPYHVHGWMHEQKCATISGDFIQPPQKNNKKDKISWGQEMRSSSPPPTRARRLKLPRPFAYFTIVQLYIYIM